MSKVYKSTSPIGCGMPGYSMGTYTSFSQFRENLHQYFFTLIDSYFYLRFYPMPVLAFRVLSLSASVRPSVSQSIRPSVTKFVRAITQHPPKLGSPTLDHRCKRPWLKSLLFWGWLTSWPSRSNLTYKSKFTPCWPCPRDNSSPV